MRSISLFISIALGLPTTALAGNAYGHYNVGDATVFATMPAGSEYPEGVMVDEARDLLYVTRPAAGPTNGWPASSILVYNLENGNQVATITVQGENTAEQHALVEGALDADGNVYVNSDQLGTLKFERQGCGYNWTQSSYSNGAYPIIIPLPPIPGLPPSIPNGMAFGPDGELYVPDSMQGILFMVPPGGGSPVPLIVDPVQFGFFSGGRMGMNGIKLNPDHTEIYFSVSGGDGDGPGPNPGTTGKIFRVPVDFSTAPEMVFEYGLNDIPDGIAFSAHGDLLVVLAGDDSISVLTDLDSTAWESNRFGAVGSPIGFVQPSTIAMPPHSKFAYVVNHALDAVPVGSPVPDPSPFVVHKIYVGDRGDALP